MADESDVEIDAWLESFQADIERFQADIEEAKKATEGYLDEMKQAFEKAFERMDQFFLPRIPSHAVE
jgi:hypothetical protein